MKLSSGVSIAALVCACALPRPAPACPADTRASPRLREAGTWLERAERAEIPLDQVLAAAGGPPEAVGRWQPPRSWPLTAIHAALLPTGEVLVYSRKTAAEDVEAALWDPSDDSFTVVDLDRDLFCGALALLADGRLFVAGGNDVGCAFRGIADTHLFDPFARTLRRLGDMAVARWYPTATTLADGRVLITSGLDRRCRLTPLMEIYTPGGGVTAVPGGARPLELYPRLHLLSNGEVAHVGIEAGTALFDPRSGRWRTGVATSQAGRRWAGTSVSVPGRPDSVLILGGGTPPTRSVERIDFDRESPRWRPVAPMHLARAHHHAVILPDRTVLVIGGGGLGLYQDPVLEAERYDPEADAWTLLPAQALPRMYHSTALLLPDGRVLSAGQDHGPSAMSAEIYEPAYLFRGPRPEVLEVPEHLEYGRTFTLRVDDPSAIASVVLIAPGRTTHGVDMGQRLVTLEFASPAGSGLAVEPPARLGLAPPGPYLLFVLDRAGVPSHGRFVRLTVPTKPVLEAPG